MKKLTGRFLETEYGYTDIHGTNVWFMAMVFFKQFSALGILSSNKNLLSSQVLSANEKGAVLVKLRGSKPASIPTR